MRIYKIPVSIITIKNYLPWFSVKSYSNDMNLSEIGDFESCREGCWTNCFVLLGASNRSRCAWSCSIGVEASRSISAGTEVLISWGVQVHVLPSSDDHVVLSTVAAQLLRTQHILLNQVVVGRILRKSIHSFCMTPKEAKLRRKHVFSEAHTT